MRRFRFSIASILGVVVFVAIAVAALRESSESWDSGLFGVTMLALLIAVLMAVYHTDRRRAYWLGFALFGWAYLGASLIPPIESRLPTTKGLAFIDAKVPGRSVNLTFRVMGKLNGGNNNLTVQTYDVTSDTHSFSGQRGSVRLWDAVTGRLLSSPIGTSENFLRIGHTLLALLIAWVGGALSRYLHDSGVRLRGEAG